MTLEFHSIDPILAARGVLKFPLAADLLLQEFDPRVVVVIIGLGQVADF